MVRPPPSIQRGDIWWADLPDRRGSERGFRRPVLILQADSFNRSRIRTVIAVVVTTNIDLANAPGNVQLSATISKLPRNSVVNVSQVITLDRAFLLERVARLPAGVQEAVDNGLRMILNL